MNICHTHRSWRPSALSGTEETGTGRSCGRAALVGVSALRLFSLERGLPGPLSPQQELFPRSPRAASLWPRPLPALELTGFM